MKRWIKRIGLTIVVLTAFIVLPLMFPSPLFAYSVNYQNLSVYSDLPLPQKQATAFLTEVKSRLSRFPSLDNGAPKQIYIANTKWRQKWLWIVTASNAGGFTVAPITRNHAFFSGADFQTNELIGPTGYKTKPPRTLAYFGSHELTHVTMAHKLGTIRFHLLPEWIREGIPDYVALPDQSAKDLYHQIGKKHADLKMIKAHGVYAPYRLLVAFFLNEKHWDLDKLMASNLTYEQARKIAFKGLDKS